eukprot:TRINITY_DN1785_c0_g1_i1.p1 TRINITY_DN1785_c0_g1~~TRINITY_DN1785_c0_g1_i1.p1  ORF type:complete len:279 (-),score=78.93 TRINITY_DN1785_c0_g1_i1:532-1368(-)
MESDLNRFFNEVKLESFHMNYFKIIHELGDVINFLRAQGNKFGERAVLLDGQLQGYKFGTDLLNNLTTAHSLLKPIVMKEQSMINLANQVRTLFKNEEQLGQMLNVKENLESIKIWFAQLASGNVTLDTMLPYIIQLKKKAKFECRMSTHNDKPSKLILSLKEKNRNGNEILQELPQDKVKDVIKAVAIFVNQDDIFDSPKKQIVSDFVDCFRIASEIHNLILQLEYWGHPYFQLDCFFVNEGTDDMNVEKFNEMKENLNNQLINWKKKNKTSIGNLP